MTNRLADRTVAQDWDTPSFAVHRVPGRYGVYQAVQLRGAEVVRSGPEEPSSYAAQRAANWLQSWALDQQGQPASQWPAAEAELEQEG